MNASPKRFWSGPSLALQIMGLLLGGLVVAQLVTLALTWLLPPEPQPTYGLQDIARVLAVASPDGRGPFQRVIENGPPQPTGPGWLTSERSRHDLAMLLGRDDADVRLFFFTPLPFAGATGVAPREPPPISKRPIAFDDDAAPVRLAYADYQIAQARPGGAPGGPGGPGGAGPGGPGGPGNPTGMSGPGGGGPTGGTPRGAMPPSSAGTNDRRTTNAPPGDGSFNTVRPSDVPGARSAPTMSRGMETG